MDQLMKAAVFVPCAVCGQAMVFGFAMRMVDPCKHAAHQWCTVNRCTFCYKPPSSYRSMFRALSYTWYGFMGEAQAGAGEYRRSVMMASTLGFLWAAELILKLIRFVTRPVTRYLSIPIPNHEPALYFIVFVWLYYRFVDLLVFRWIPPWLAGRHVGTLVPSCVALWVSGEYGMDWIHPAGHVVDIGLCLATTHAFQWWDLTGSVAVFLVVFHHVWRWPSIWDIHSGNCCGAWSVTLGMFVSSFVSGLVLGAIVHETFDSVPAVHSILITRFLFSKQVADPFTEFSASRVREVFWGIFVMFLVLGGHRRLMHA